MRTNQTFRSTFSFSKDELRGEKARLHIGEVGLPLECLHPGAAAEFGGVVREYLGLFGGSNNANVVIPDATAAGIMPKEEDFLKQKFRLISATVVAAGSWRSTEFPADVLKASVKALANKPIFYDHDTDLLNIVGIVKEPEWAAASTSKAVVGGKETSVTVPAGINGTLWLDTKGSTKLARAVAFGGVFSNSVTVSFSWKPSHNMESADEFERLVGTMHKDGTMIRRVATEVYDYFETSLVWLGADPYAKLIDKDGHLVNIDTSSTYNLRKEVFQEKGFFQVARGLDEGVLHLSLSGTKKPEPQPPAPTPEKLELPMKLNALAQLSILTKLRATDKYKNIADDTELTSEHVEALMAMDQEAKKKVSTYDALTAEAGAELADSIAKGEVSLVKKTDKAELATFRTEKAANAAVIDFGKKVLDGFRKEGERLYRLSLAEGTAADETIIKAFKEGTPEQVETACKTHLSGAVEKFGGHCEDCGSTNYSFRASLAPEQGGGGKKNVAEVPLSADDIMEMGRMEAIASSAPAVAKKEEEVAK